MPKINGQLLYLSLALLINGSLYSAADANMNELKLKEIVQKTDVLGPQARKQITTSINGELACISVYRYPKATEKDCKIDTILLAKEIMQADPDGIKRVKIIFWDMNATNQSWEIEVNATEVKAFASGAVQKDELLKSISFVVKNNTAQQTNDLSKYVNVSDLTKLAVVAGSDASDRLILITKICNLRQKASESGISELNTLQYIKNFATIEEFVRQRKPNTLIRRHIDTLAQEVSKGIAYYNHRINVLNAQAREKANSKRPVTAISNPNQLSNSTNSDEQMWKLLFEKYPNLAPSKNGRAFEHRYTIAKRLIQLAESGNNIDGFISQFKILEQASLSGDNRLFETRMSNLESQLGLSSFSPAH